MPDVRHGWPLALGAAVAAAEVGVELLRPHPAPPAPAAVDRRAHYTDEQVARARRHQRPQLALRVAADLVDAGVLAASAALVAAAARRAPRAAGGGLATAVLTGAGLSVARDGARLPLVMLSRRRAHDPQDGPQQWDGWRRDTLRSAAITAVERAAGAGALVVLGRRAGARWWLPAAGLSVAWTAARAMAQPVLLDPLANTFHPLPEGRARDEVFGFAQATRTPLRQVYVMDASRHGSLANAYAAGLGPTRRIVLYDTLLEHFTPEEVRIVLAHELSHVRHHDRLRSLALASIAGPFAFRAAHLLLGRVAPGTPVPDRAAALPATLLALTALQSALSPARKRLSRRIEERADRESLELTGEAEALVAFERRIVLHNRAELEPSRWRVALFEDHPPTLARIGAAAGYAPRVVRTAATPAVGAAAGAPAIAR